MPRSPRLFEGGGRGGGGWITQRHWPVLTTAGATLTDPRIDRGGHTDKLLSLKLLVTDIPTPFSEPPKRPAWRDVANPQSMTCDDPPLGECQDSPNKRA